jgi:hypothetical protein
MGPELLEVIPQWSCHHQVMQEVKGKLMVFLPPGIGGKSPATFFQLVGLGLWLFVSHNFCMYNAHCFTHPDLQAVLEMKLRCRSRLDGRFHSHFSDCFTARTLRLPDWSDLFGDF